MYRKEKGSEVVRQLVIPRVLCNQVMKLGNEIILSGQQGIRKLLDSSKLLLLGIIGDVHWFCQSCDICQRTVSRGSAPRAPVQMMPMVNTTFEKVDIWWIP